MHVRCPDRLPEETYRQVLEEMAELSPVVPGAAWEKTSRLPEPSAHDDDLRALAYRLIDAAGLQRGRLTGLALKGEDLVDAGQVAQQITSTTPERPGWWPRRSSTASVTSSAPVSSARPPSTAAPRDPTRPCSASGGSWERCPATSMSRKRRLVGRPRAG